MKKLFALVALVLGVVSCQTDPNDLDVVVGGEREVMLNVSLPEATRSASNAGFDFTDFENNTNYDLRYILEIRYNGHVSRTVKTAESTSVSFPVRLAPGREYDFTVWADLVLEGSEDDLYYNTNVDGAGLTNITFKEWTPNNELRDAYYGKATLAQDQSITNLGTIELTRPFAKVRVISTDIADVRKFGIEPKSVSVKYINAVYTSFNAVTGVAGTPLANQTVSAEYANAKYDDFNTAEATLFADYIFVPEDGTIQFSMDVKTEGDASIKATSFTTPIAVVKNKLTTIKGAVLTEGGDVSIKIENGLGELETINLVDTAADLQEIINNTPDGESANITLGGDIDLNDLFGISTLSTRAAEPAYGLLIPAGKSVVLDLKGFTISQSKECKASYSMIQNNGNLTIIDGSEAKSGKISFKDTSAGDPTFGWGSYTISNYGGTLVVENGTIEHLGEQNSATEVKHMICAIWQYSGSTTINGGVISTPNYRSARLWGGDMTINGGEFEGQLWLQAVNNTSNLTINGGTFAPRGKDGSSVFVTNSDYDVKFAVKGGHFTTKIGASKPFGCITAGTFTTAAKEGTNIALVNDDYAWVETENGLWTVERRADVVKIGEVGYTSLQKAVAEAQNGDTVLFIADVEQEDGVIITDKNITIDLNGNTFTVSNGASTNNRNLKVNGSSVVTIKNGNMVAEGDYSSGAYGTLRTEGTANVTLEDVKLYNYRGNGLNVKALSGTTVTINDTEIYSHYGGGIESAGGTIELTNVKVEQEGMYTAPYNSMAISVNGGGTVTVNSGTYSTECITAEEANNQGTSHGPWCAGVLNSGGTLIIKGGTFSNDNFGENALATYARGLLLADTGANIQIEGGTFNAVKSIVDIQNNLGDASRNPSATISGGYFSANPLTWAGLINVVAGYGVVEENGVWKVAKAYDITEGGATIYSAAGMLWFANEVNVNKNAFNGKTVTLANDIDLKNENWAGIGTEEANFCGTFDGYNHTIKNLNILVSEAKEGKAYLGLFGYAKNATIKNVVFENVDINVACLDIDHSQGHIGAVAGSLEGTSTIENVTVQGDVKVYATQDANGASRVAVVAGGNSYGNVTMKNVHVVANEGSYLIANNNTGALAGQLQGKSVFENCSSNIDVTVNKFFAGGIIGLAAGDQTFTNCHTTGNIAVVAGREGRAHDQYRVGGIAGGWSDGKNNVCTLVNCSYTGNVSGKNSDGSVANPLDYMGYVGRGYTLNGCQGSTVVIDGVRYVQKYDTAAEAGIYDVTDAEGNVVVSTFAELEAALQAGGNIALGADIALDNPIQVNNKEFYLNGRGHKIGQSSAYNIEGTSTAALIHPIGCTAIIENIVFDGIKGDGPIRTVDTKINIKNITVQNCERTATGSTAQGLFRLHGESIVTACTFKNNICPMGVSLNWDGDNNLPQSVTNCVFEGNTCHATAVLYYVKGSECKVIGNKFVDNTVTVESGNNAATVYMGFTENNVITGNLFQNNTVNAGTSKRVAGGIMIGYEAEITGNAFIGNSVTGENAKGNDVCASVYYTDIDLSGNYWGGGAPVENDDYFVEYTNYKVIVNDYLTENPIK